MAPFNGWGSTVSRLESHATMRRKFTFYHYESCKNLTKMFLKDFHYKISELNRESEHFMFEIFEKTA